MAETIEAFKVQQYDNCGHSPAWPMVPSAMLDLQAQGLAFEPHQAPAYNDGCLVAVDENGASVGFLAYRHDDLKCSWFIMLAYVAPQHRRKGIHTALFSALVERATKRGDILAIESGTHVNNKAAQAAFDAQGRERQAIMYTYKIKDWMDGNDPLEVKA